MSDVATINSISAKNESSSSSAVEEAHDRVVVNSCTTSTGGQRTEESGTKSPASASHTMPCTNSGTPSAIPTSLKPTRGTSASHISIDMQQEEEEEEEAGSIDSALLSALRDPRERRTLFRLEQMLVDFMKNSDQFYLDVGPFSQVKIQNNFQRLILHRLADRFRIARESIGFQQQMNSNPYFGVMSPQQQQLLSSNNQLTPFTIRLIKTEKSSIPAQLLIDADESSLFSEQEQGDNIITSNTTSYFSEPCSSAASNYYNNITQPTESAKGPFDTTSLARALPDAPTGISAVTTPAVQGTSSNKKKMMIMKRGTHGSSSFTSNGNSSDKKSASKRSLRGKNLSDKEKAYAEARARIFAEENENLRKEEDECDNLLMSRNNSSNNMGPLDEQQQQDCNEQQQEYKQEQQQPSFRDSSNLLNVKDNINNSPPSPTTSSLINQEDVNTMPIFSANGSNPNCNSQSKSSSVVSKVTWRNRKQEECDPDFQRRRAAGVVVPTMLSTYGDNLSIATSSAGYLLSSSTASNNIPQSQDSYGAAILYSQHQQQRIATVQQQYYYPSTTTVYTSASSANNVYYSEYPPYQPQIFYPTTSTKINNAQQELYSSNNNVGSFCMMSTGEATTPDVAINGNNSNSAAIPASKASHSYNSEFPALR